MRILLFTGKGGVGKTTVAAATAVARAEPGCARSSCRPIPPTRSPTRSTCPLGDQPDADRAEPLGPAAQRARAVRGGVGRRPRATWSTCSTGPAPTRSRPRSSRSSPASTRCSRSPTSSSSRRRASTTSSSSTARRRPRRSGCSRCPTCSAGTWTACSTRSAGSRSSRARCSAACSGMPVAGDEVFGGDPPLLRPPRRRARAAHRRRRSRARGSSSTPSGWSSPRPGARTRISRCSATTSTR